MRGIVRGIFLADRARQPLRAVAEVQALAGCGLEGDRYCVGHGAMSRWPGPARQVSLIDEAAVTAALAEHDIDLADGRSRRNVVTAGIELGKLVRRKFRAGAAILRGVGHCLPCHYLERLTHEGAFQALRGRGGLRAEVIESGLICVGDAIEQLVE